MIINDAPNTGETASIHAAVETLTEKVSVLVSQISLMAEEIAALREAAEAQRDRDRLYDVKSLADRWLVSERTIHTLVSEDLIVPTYVQTALRFTRDAVEAYERSRSGARHARRAKAYRRRPAVVRDPVTLEVISTSARSRI